jgi:FkbM family methyltransferase
MKLIQKFACSLGYELIRKKKHPSLGSHLINLINLYNINVVLDVGANQGQFGRMARNLGYDGEIHSFEPVSETFEKLCKEASGDPNWHLHKIGLGEVDKQAVINVAKSSDLSSILTPNSFGKEKYQKIEVDRQETIEIQALDNFISAWHLNGKQILLKMDTQGYDLNVFAGATNSIDSIFCMLSELSITPIYSGIPGYQIALKTYESAGFQISGIYPVSRNQDLSVIEMDCFLVNRSKFKP